MSMTIQSSVKDKILATLSETSKVENALAEMLCDLDQQIEKRADDGKANVVTDALSRKERVKPRRVRAMAMIIQYGVRGMILAAQSEAFKQENGMMRTVVMDEAHASSYHSSIWCAPFEALYGRKCRSPVLWAEIEESSLIGHELVQETTDKWLIGLRLIEELSGYMDTFHYVKPKKTMSGGCFLPVPLDEDQDGKVKVVSEASIRIHLKLEDSYGISTLPTLEIFEQLALMGNMKRDSKGYTRVDTPLFQTMLVQGQILQGEGSPIPVHSHHTPISAPSTSQPPTSPPSMQTTHVAEEAANMPHDSPLLEGHTPGSDEGRKQKNELMDLVIKLTDRVEVLENDLKQTKRVYGDAFTKLIKKVKALEKTVKSRKARRKTKLVVSNDKEEDSFNQGKKIAEINEDPHISLVQQIIHHDAQTQGRQEHDLEPNFEFTTHDEVYTAEPDISTANVPVSTAGTEVSTAIPELSTAAESLVYIRRSAARRKDKGKAIVEESEPTQTKTKI
ncbi:hypothetical protein Tco_0448027 [Tanacetum coccineum]